MRVLDLSVMRCGHEDGAYEFEKLRGVDVVVEFELLVVVHHLLVD